MARFLFWPWLRGSAYANLDASAVAPRSETTEAFLRSAGGSR